MIKKSFILIKQHSTKIHLPEEGLSRFGWTCKHKLALGSVCQERTNHPIEGQVPPRNIDEHLQNPKPTLNYFK